MDPASPGGLHGHDGPVLGADRPEIIEDWADLFQALSDINRLRILLAVHYSPGINVTDLAESVGDGCERHFACPGGAPRPGIIRSERVGRERRWSIASDQIHALLHDVGATHSPLHPES